MEGVVFKAWKSEGRQPLQLSARLDWPEAAILPPSYCHANVSTANQMTLLHPRYEANSHNGGTAPKAIPAEGTCAASTRGPAGPPHGVGCYGLGDWNRVFLCWLFGGILACVLGYSLAAVTVDPRGYFGTGLFPASALNSRQLKLSLFREYSRGGQIDGIILGSSRSMAVSPRLLDEQGLGRSFNFAVNSARSEDYFAIFQWSIAEGAKTKWLLLGLDVEALHNVVRLDDRLRTNPPLMAALGESKLDRFRNETSSWFAISEAVVSDGYAMDMLTSLRAQSGDFLEWIHLESDGCVSFPRWERDRQQGSFSLDNNILRSCDEYRRRFASMTALSRERVDLLERLLEAATSRQVRVVVWITPLHPRVVQALERDTGFATVLNETRALVSELGRRFGVRTLDFSEPRSFGGNSVDWWDGAHINEQNAARLAVRLAQELRRDGS